jgi:hypothetical protein
MQGSNSRRLKLRLLESFPFSLLKEPYSFGGGIHKFWLDGGGYFGYPDPEKESFSVVF